MCKRDKLRLPGGEIELLCVAIMIENSQHSGMKTICIEPFIFSYSVNDPDRLREQREGGKREEDDCGVGVLYEHEAEVVFHANTMNKTFCNTIRQIAAHTQNQFLQIKNGFWKYKVSFKRKAQQAERSHLRPLYNCTKKGGARTHI